jgi:hypothetical protein
VQSQERKAAIVPKTGDWPNDDAEGTDGMPHASWNGISSSPGCATIFKDLRDSTRLVFVPCCIAKTRKSKKWADWPGNINLKILNAMLLSYLTVKPHLKRKTKSRNMGSA